MKTPAVHPADPGERKSSLRQAVALQAAPVTMFTQSSDGILPEDGGGRVVFVIVGAAILGLYFMIRRTRARAVDHYNERKRREQAQRDADPDLRRDET